MALSSFQCAGTFLSTSTKPMTVSFSIRSMSSTPSAAILGPPNPWTLTPGTWALSSRTKAAA